MGPEITLKGQSLSRWVALAGVYSVINREAGTAGFFSAEQNGRERALGSNQWEGKHQSQDVRQGRK